MAITAYLYYEDVASSLKWLSKAFGFKRYGPNVVRADGRVSHASMRFGDAIVMMGQPDDPKFKNPKHLGRSTHCLYVNVENVDKHFARARKAGAKVLEAPADTDYGHRRCGLEDPEGHKWYFAQELSKISKPRLRRKSK